MRAFWLAVPFATLLATASALAAQEATPATRTVPALPTIGLPLPHIGLPPPEPVETKAPDDGVASRPQPRRSARREPAELEPGIAPGLRGDPEFTDLDPHAG